MTRCDIYSVILFENKTDSAINSTLYGKDKDNKDNEYTYNLKVSPGNKKYMTLGLGPIESFFKELTELEMIQGNDTIIYSNEEELYKMLIEHKVKSYKAVIKMEGDSIVNHLRKAKKLQ